MRVGIVGTGYVGSVSGAGFAAAGNNVISVDKSPEIVERMRMGEVDAHIYEPGLQDMVRSNLAANRIEYTGDTEYMVKNSDLIFLAVPTPQGEDDTADLSYVMAAAKEIAQYADHRLVIVDKSTVPVGTAKWVKEMVRSVTDVEIAVVSNPEFLREGSALHDFNFPDQIVIGADEEDSWAAEMMKELYSPFERTDETKIDIMDPFSAEAVKYGINAFLALKVTFANEFAEFCKRSGADYRKVGPAVGRDKRIGDKFMLPGPGWGGSCFPKDTRAVVRLAETFGVDLSTIKAAIESNELRKRVLPQRVIDFHDGNVEGLWVGMWGAAFKANTDDIRESPALPVIDELTSRGAHVRVYDPKAIRSLQRVPKYNDNPGLTFADNAYECVDGVDALVIATEWKEFFGFDRSRVLRLMRKPVIFDGRDTHDPSIMKEAGFYYDPMGSPAVDGRRAA